MFASSWRVAAPLDETWSFLTSPGQRWVDWWPGLETADVRSADSWPRTEHGPVRLAQPGDYRLTFTLTLTGVDPAAWSSSPPTVT